MRSRCTNWTPMDDAVADNLLKAMNGEPAGDGWESKVGSVVREMMPRAEKFHL